MNKFTHLMKDNKSAQSRTGLNKPSPKKTRAGMPQYHSLNSPKKAPKSPKGRSPSQKVQFADPGDSNNIINLRSTPTKEDPDEIEDPPEQIMETIEGVTGDIVMSSSEEDRIVSYPAFDDEVELKKGESGMNSSDSSEGTGQIVDEKDKTVA